MARRRESVRLYISEVTHNGQKLIRRLRNGLQRRTKDRGPTDRDTLHHLPSEQRERERRRGQDEDEPAISRENKMISLP